MFLAADGAHFTRNGQPVLLSGANTYYLGYKSRGMVDAALDTALSLGANVVRTWAFLDAGRLPDGEKEGVCFQYLDENGTVQVREGEQGLGRLDYVIHAAEQRGLMLILPLVNNWIDFGGIARYIDWFPELRYHDEFYTAGPARERYKEWARTLLNRVNTITGVAYRDEPAIAAWELANEPRWSGSPNGKPSSGPARRGVIRDWAAEVSEFLRREDPNHLIAIGDEGFFADRRSSGFLYDGSSGTDFNDFLALPYIDFGTFHMYPEEWRNAGWGEKWIDEHLEAGALARKPVLLEEYGLRDESLRNTRYAAWLDRMNAAGGGFLVWMVAARQDDGTPYPDYDRFTIYHELDAPPVRAFARRISRPRSGSGNLILSLLTSEGEPIRENGVRFRFDPQESSIDHTATVDLTGEPVAIELPMTGSPRSLYAVSVTPRTYRFGALGIVAVPEGSSAVLAKPLPREPEQWRARFTRWPELGSLFEPLKQTLERSPDLRYFRSEEPGKLRTDQAWEEFGRGAGELPKACLLNLYHALSALKEPVSRERTWWSMFESLLEAGRERIIARVPFDAAQAIREISINIEEYSAEYRRAEDPERHRAYVPARFRNSIDSVFSVKTVENRGNIQFTAVFLRNETFALMDADIDDNGCALLHLFDVLRHRFTGGTHPFDVHELLRQAALRAHVAVDLGYTLEPRAMPVESPDYIQT